MRITTVALALMLCGAGCAAEATNDKPDAADTAVQVIRTKGRARNQNDLRQLALYYLQFEIDRTRPPAEWKELREFMGNEGAGIARLVDEGSFVVVYKVKPRSDVIVAHEKAPSQGDQLLVAMGDGSVQRLSPAQLQAKLEQQAQPR